MFIFAKKYFMKKILYSFAIVGWMASCQSAPEGEQAQTTEKKEAMAVTGTSYVANTAQSSVTFIGSKPTGTHTGVFMIKEGQVALTDNKVSGGKFVMDISSMVCKDADTNGSYKLIGHLLSPDFFDVAKYPTATFEITGCELLSNDSVGNTHTISGNLTLKDSTKNISFPAKIETTETEIAIKADFNINRTLWGLHYGNDKSLGDKFIYPDVHIQLDIKGNKQ